MNVLAIDTSTKRFSLALAKDQKVLSYRNITLTGVLSSSIVPVIDKLLSSKGLVIGEIDGYVVGLGPGSFTSLRVGLSTIKAFSYVHNKPIVGISSLDVIAENADADGDICVVCDAKRRMVYSARYRRTGGILKRLSEYSLSPIQDVLKDIKDPAVFTGDGVGLYKDDIMKHMRSKGWGSKTLLAEEKKWLPDAKKMIGLAKDRFKQRKFDNVDKLVPLYLYPQDCQVRK